MIHSALVYTSASFLILIFWWYVQYEECIRFDVRTHYFVQFRYNLTLFFYFIV